PGHRSEEAHRRPTAPARPQDRKLGMLRCRPRACLERPGYREKARDNDECSQGRAGCSGHARA
ncbi:hypothetical protein ABTM70_20900, partial [Acinetobacter baumannii]